MHIQLVVLLYIIIYYYYIFTLHIIIETLVRPVRHFKNHLFQTLFFLCVFHHELIIIYIGLNLFLWSVFCVFIKFSLKNNYILKSGIHINIHVYMYMYITIGSVCYKPRLLEYSYAINSTGDIALHLNGKYERGVPLILIFNPLHSPLWQLIKKSWRSIINSSQRQSFNIRYSVMFFI